jgi:hypothetical protein
MQRLLSISLLVAWIAWGCRQSPESRTARLSGDCPAAVSGTFSIVAVDPNTGLCGAARLAIEAGKTIVIDTPQTIALADQLGICVLGW